LSNRGCSRWFFGGLIILLVIAGILGLATWEFLVPYQGSPGGVFVELERGTTTKQLADRLQDEGVIRSRYAFLIWRALHPKTTLQAGEYFFDKPLTPGDVFEKIHRGQIYFEELAIPEGSNMYDISALLKNLHSVKPEDFLKAATDPQTIRDLDPAAPTLEGYLFPSTYRVTRKTTAVELCRLMTAEFRRQWRSLTEGRSGTDVHRVVTMASMVEKETAIPDERPLIAAVFENRLHQNMPLQCDPTVVYASLRQNRYRGTIYKSDLTSTDPYNTYTHTGMPPGPVSNPGIASLKAALDPAKADYLYFVARPGSSGHHTFSSTLKEHDLAVRAYRAGH
jgi:UPF0755 protein